MAETNQIKLSKNIFQGNLTANSTFESRQVTFAIHETEYGKSEAFFNYMSWCHCFIFVDIPWITVALLNIFIMRKMRERSRVQGITLQSKGPDKN